MSMKLYESRGIHAAGVARDLQELCDFNRLSRFRHVLQEQLELQGHTCPVTGVHESTVFG